MNKTQNLAGVLINLLKINNDRIGIYQKAVKEIDEHDMRMAFRNAIEESKVIEYGLVAEIFKRDSMPDLDAKTTTGQLYKNWLYIKEFFTGRDYSTTIRACEFAEYSVQKAYEEALKRDDVPSELSQVLSHQATLLRNSYRKLMSSDMRESSGKLLTTA